MYRKTIIYPDAFIGPMEHEGAHWRSSGSIENDKAFWLWLSRRLWDLELTGHGSVYMYASTLYSYLSSYSNPMRYKEWREWHVYVEEDSPWYDRWGIS